MGLGIPVGGWCPRGRRTEDGRLTRRYPLVETPSPAYPQRTDWNVRDSDATLILSPGPLKGGTALTAQLARDRHKPLLVVDLDTARPAEVETWLQRHRPCTLNVAGPRESQAPGIYAQSRAFLEAVLGRSRPGV